MENTNPARGDIELRVTDLVIPGRPARHIRPYIFDGTNWQKFGWSDDVPMGSEQLKSEHEVLYGPKASILSQRLSQSKGEPVAASMLGYWTVSPLS